MKRFLVAAGLLILSTGLVVVAPVGSAQAAACTTTPRQAVVSEKAKKVTFDVPDADEWKLKIKDLGLSSSTAHPSVVLKRTDLKNSDAGLHAVKVTTDRARCTSTFRLLRDATVSIGAYKDGKTRVVYGRLFQIDFGVRSYSWPQEPWVPLNKKTVTIQFKSPTTGKWTTAGQVEADQDGAFTLRKKIGKRTWRAVYAGSATTAKDTSKVVSG